MSENAAKQKPEAIVVSRAELPLSCPRPGAPVYEEHPRVFLAIEKTGETECPYCGARYLLKD